MNDQFIALKFKQVKWLVIISYISAFIIDATLNISLGIHLISSLTLLMLIFWITQLLTETHLFTAFILGIVMDTYLNTLLGSHSLIFIIITLLVLRTRNGFKNYPLWQQTSIIILYLYFFQIFSFLSFNPSLENGQLLYWLSPISALLVWPILFKTMRYLTIKSAR